MRYAFQEWKCTLCCLLGRKSIQFGASSNRTQKNAGQMYHILLDILATSSSAMPDTKTRTRLARHDSTLRPKAKLLFTDSRLHYPD